MNSRVLLKSVAGLVALLMVCCSKGETSVPSLSLPPASTSPQSLATTNSLIRQIDFDKLTYRNFPDYSGERKKSITLRPGEGGPNLINYGDVTGDGMEEAMAVLGIDIKGSAVPEYVYIFTMEREKPKVIWDFETGDRADGGLRQVYAENGQLVIELFGRDRVIGGELYKGDEGLCCPSLFTRTRYKWTEKQFQEISREVLPNPSGDANSIMPRYTPKS